MWIIKKNDDQFRTYNLPPFHVQMELIKTQWCLLWQTCRIIQSSQPIINEKMQYLSNVVR